MNQPQVYFRLFGDSNSADAKTALMESDLARSIRFRPGTLLNCEYRIELRADAEVTAVETSVLWITTGKGDEDIGVHFFERRENKMVQPEVLRQTHKLSTLLPKSPLSYDGEIVKIQWCVRVRIFLVDGTQITEDCTFKMGNVSLERLQSLSEQQQQDEKELDNDSDYETGNQMEHEDESHDAPI